MAAAPRSPAPQNAPGPRRRAGTPAVEVRVSDRRRSTATAFWEGDQVVVVVPPRLPRATREDLVDRLVARVLRHRPHVHASDADLARRAEALADQHLDGVRPASIRWVGNQLKRWGSCTPATREIRISDRLRPVPGWVLDAVVVHELAHLVEPGHGPRFRLLAGRYGRHAEAARFLEGYALGLAIEPPGLDDGSSCERADGAPTFRGG